MNRTKENEELSVSNSQRVCTYLQHSSIRPSLGITISFSPSLTYPGGSTWLPWIANLANKELSQATQAQTFSFNIGHSTSSFKGFSQPGSIPPPPSARATPLVSEAPETPALAWQHGPQQLLPRIVGSGLIECLSLQLCRFKR